MSDPKIISPLLDGFTLGSPISEHHGVICCPAIKENTNKKFIIKIITVPATQAQFDALLLAGAYKDPGDAMAYFQEKGENILHEAEILKTLSKLEGFLPYDGWQMEAITRRRLGYEVYLVGSYKRSLDKYMRTHSFTHLEAVNLGLDLCSALSVCRHSGYLYVALKPNNIYVSENKEYRIGDLGFLSMDSLRYASLPERCLGPYTPPELLDPMTPMNLTVDTYAVGMILYQLYNDGQLPFRGTAPVDSLPNPCHADYEMAEIIMKAIHPDPEHRWSDPKELGKAIAAYMQRNGINDIPITPFIPLDVQPENIVPADSQHEYEEALQDQDANPENSTDSTADETTFQEESFASDEVSDEMEEFPSDEDTQPSAESNCEMKTVFADVLSADETEDNIEQPAESEDKVTPPIIMQEKCEITESAVLEDISEEVVKIVSKADDIIAHEIPKELSLPIEEESEDPFAFVRENVEDMEDDFSAEPLMEEEPVPPKKKKTKHFENTAVKKKVKKFLSGCLSVLFLCCAAVGGYWFYQNIYLQSIQNLTISGTQNEITVLVDTAIEESQLKVYCIDEDGKQRSSVVEGGKATFSDLKPSTTYTIQMDMNGFHKLKGQTSDTFTTDALTHILSFQAIAGSEDGSVKLEFTVDGSDPDFWNIRYTAEGEEELRETVIGHSAMITGLSIGKTYTFTLDGGKDFDLSGETSVQYLASRLILAENLMVTSSDGSDVTVSWDTPGDVVVESWNIRLYDGYGFEEIQTVTENQAVFTGLDSASHYTAEVTAVGMTQPSTITISADPIHVTALKTDETAKTEMKLSWEYNGTDPEGGWLLSYTVDGSGSQTIPCPKPSAVVSPLIPGANYKFVLMAADERTVFNNTKVHRTSEAEVYSENNFDPENISIDLLKTPEESSWSFETISPESFTKTFAVGDSASLVLQSTTSIYVPSNKTKILFVFRDTYGNVLPELISEVTCTWKNIWTKGDVKTGEIDIPLLPDSTGEYLLDLYFNGRSAAQLEITVTE